MVIPPFSKAIQRIEQHLVRSNETIQEMTSANLSRVQEVYFQLEKELIRIYQAGEGWIEKDVYTIIDAIIFAAKKHQRQFRKDKTQTSYIVHPLSVALHLLTVGKVRNPAIIIAGLLHDILEDTHTSCEELVEQFGEQVTCFVQEVTDDKSLPKEERKRLQIITAPEKSAGAAQIKLADKRDNLKDLLNFPPLDWPKQRIHAYFEWAETVIHALPWVNAKLLQSTQQVIEEYKNQK